eukprot:6561689-Prymnesium_polylepis.3
MCVADPASSDLRPSRDRSRVCLTNGPTACGTPRDAQVTAASCTRCTLAVGPCVLLLSGQADGQGILVARLGTTGCSGDAHRRSTGQRAEGCTAQGGRAEEAGLPGAETRPPRAQARQPEHDGPSCDAEQLDERFARAGASG